VKIAALYLLGFAGLTAALIAYGHLLHDPVELVRDPEAEEIRAQLMQGVDDAVLNGRRLSAALQRLLDEQLNLTMAAGYQ
jgi:type II secretory pathway component PulF